MNLDELGKAIAESFDSNPNFSIKDLIEMNIECYEDSFRKNNPHAVVVCQAVHIQYLQNAKNQNINTSNYPKELNYLQKEN